MAGPLDLRFVSSFADVDQLPGTNAEMAVVGRSNVGKSSLINALAGRKSLAKTSKTPGATRLLNAYEVGPVGSGRWLVDLPGYGYAKRSKSEQQRWATMIDRYLTERQQLEIVMLLIDAEVGPTSLDLQTQEWLAHIGLDLVHVATKSDKVRSSKSRRRRIDLVEGLGVAKSEVIWVSAVKGTGIAELRAAISRRLGPA